MKYFVNIFSRVGTCSSCSVFSIEAQYRFTNHAKEYWYMGSMFVKFAENVSFSVKNVKDLKNKA